MKKYHIQVIPYIDWYSLQKSLGNDIMYYEHDGIVGIVDSGYLKAVSRVRPIEDRDWQYGKATLILPDIKDLI